MPGSDRWAQGVERQVGTGCKERGLWTIACSGVCLTVCCEMPASDRLEQRVQCEEDRLQQIISPTACCWMPAATGGRCEGGGRLAEHRCHLVILDHRCHPVKRGWEGPTTHDVLYPVAVSPLAVSGRIPSGRIPSGRIPSGHPLPVAVSPLAVLYQRHLAHGHLLLHPRAAAARSGAAALPSNPHLHCQSIHPSIHSTQHELLTGEHMM
eukprot:40645-Chlamydomonas_euryale.AAC.4